MLRGVNRLRAGALLLAGAAAVHEGRVLAEGHDGLATRPHAAVPLLVSCAAVLLAIACARFVATLHRGHASRGAVPGLRRLWLLATAALVATHVLQELIEGGVPQALAPATLVAVACAVVVGLVLSLLLRGAERLIAGRAVLESTRQRAASGRWRPATTERAPVASPLARKLASRAPPLRA